MGLGGVASGPKEPFGPLSLSALWAQRACRPSGPKGPFGPLGPKGLSALWAQRAYRPSGPKGPVGPLGPKALLGLLAPPGLNFATSRGLKPISKAVLLGR